MSGWEDDVCVSMSMCALFFMPACRPDLPITRSIKPLIPKVHASNSTTWKKNFLQRKKKSKSFLPRCLKPKPPAQHAIEHEDGNVVYLHNHTSRGLTGTLNPGTSSFHSCWVSNDGLNIIHIHKSTRKTQFQGWFWKLSGRVITLMEAVLAC